ncbi:pyruvate carboxyl transferase subunit b [hydrocarbon metagenome]|uniref:Pyruvate carboxyl transferase subunit b n=1 Tax=hydrocarbon metagenome TaxID=938273 RepID=A0A0W8FTW7_9ZZZZ
MDKAGNKMNPLKIQDNTFRDGHQSIYATRMRTEDMIPIAEEMDSCGFHAMEVWGGATFDTMHRFLGEDPWMRPKILKKYITKTPFAMLIRGQNLVGYRHYADDVVRAFVDNACEIGIDIFRCFDALNDFRNMESCAERIKANGKQFQGAFCYSLTDVSMGGEVYNLEYFVKKAKELEQMGSDAICIKDMSGILSPFDAYDLVSAVKKEIKVPLHLHSHYTSGMASMTYLKAIEAGIDVVDTCLAPFALRTSMPAIEPIVAALRGTARETGIDLHKLLELGEHLESIAPKYSSHLATHKLSIIDNGVLAHQVPGGMISNLTGQLKEMNALDKLGEIYREVAETRKDMGSPPLVTPVSQIIGAQAVLNVLFGRYVRVSNQLKDLVLGLYGKTPMPINVELTKKILKNYKRGQEPVSGRPADYLEPEIEAAKKKIGDLARNDEDVLAYILYPSTMEKFLRSKYGIDSSKSSGVENIPKKKVAA